MSNAPTMAILAVLLPGSVTAAPVTIPTLLSDTVGFVAAEVCELLNAVCVGGTMNSFLPSVTVRGGPKQFRVHVKTPDVNLILIPSIEMKDVCLWERQKK